MDVSEEVGQDNYISYEVYKTIERPCLRLQRKGQVNVIEESKYPPKPLNDHEYFRLASLTKSAASTTANPLFIAIDLRIKIFNLANVLTVIGTSRVHRVPLLQQTIYNNLFTTKLIGQIIHMAFDGSFIWTTKNAQDIALCNAYLPDNSSRP